MEQYQKGRVAAYIVVLAAVAAGLVFTTTHWLAPRLLTHYEHAPELQMVPRRSVSARGVAADPINVALVGSRDEVIRAMRSAGWTVADSATRRADVAIVKSVLLNRPDSAAPVSPLFLFGRAQDIALEREVGPSARQRHHVRLWRAYGVTHTGRPIWLGGATFDLRVGVSHRGLHPTHHIAPDVDDERDTLLSNLIHAGEVDTLFTVTGMGIRVDSHNAEGDRFDTDGEIAVAILSRVQQSAPHVDTLSEPSLVSLKNRLWAFGHRR